MNRKTASEIRVERMEQQRAYAMLSEHAHLQAEKIARHYVQHAELALQICRLLELDSDLNSVTRQVIDTLVKQIKTNHLHDLGIALEWHKDRQPEWLSQALNEGDGTYKGTP